jgi:23S rRNA (guanine745-N1)-methyltransferase
VDPDKAARLAGSLEPHLVPVEVTERRDVLRLDRSAVGTLVGMGPHARHLTADVRAGRIDALPAFTEVTVAVQVAVYRRP